jgi:hypothetical protein
VKAGFFIWCILKWTKNFIYEDENNPEQSKFDLTLDMPVVI